MMKKINKLTFLCCICVCLTYALNATPVDELQHIKNNYKRILIPAPDHSDSLLMDFLKIKPEEEFSDQVVIELHQRYPFDYQKIEKYLNLLSSDGSWADINYDDTKRSGWEPKQHAERILELSKLYYSIHTPYFKSKRIKESIHSALHYWFTAEPKSLNWWYNQIGVPKTLGAAFILLEDQLSDAEKAMAISVMEKSKLGMTGQNKVWLAGNVLICGLLQNDAGKVKVARDTIASEIVLGRTEGIKNDWSFHQHGPQQQFGNYGLSFVTGLSFFSSLFNGTSYDFDAGQLQILCALVNEGYRWIIWNRYMDIGALGRQLFHHAQVHKAYALAFAAADLGLEGFTPYANELCGYKHFDDSDYSIYRTGNWMTSVKMASNRVIGTELVNEDNLLGYYLADGTTFFYVRGDEYLDIFPFWDWRKIPGITSYDDASPLPRINTTQSGNRSDNVGGLGYGKCAMTAMELNRDGLKAYKSWLFTDQFIVCAGAGIQSDTALCVTTSVDQRVKSGELSVLNGGRWNDIKGKHVYSQHDLRFFHDQTGYIILNSDTCVALSEKRTGFWSDVMKMYREVKVDNEVVALHLRHGIRPCEGSYLYLVIPATDKRTVESFDISAVKILKNDHTAQIISLPLVNQGYWMAVYEPGELTVDGKHIYIESPGIYYVEDGESGIVVKGMKTFRTS